MDGLNLLVRNWWLNGLFIGAYALVNGCSSSQWRSPTAGESPTGYCSW